MTGDSTTLSTMKFLTTSWESPFQSYQSLNVENFPYSFGTAMTIPYWLILDICCGFYDYTIHSRPGPKSGLWTDISIRKICKKKMLMLNRVVNVHIAQCRLSVHILLDRHIYSTENPQTMIFPPIIHISITSAWFFPMFFFLGLFPGLSPWNPWLFSKF